ncbi:MAG: DUF2973 domain-containing protein [Leptolyngbyaceae bacterium]|nr:DUF2973 domain-containing protein [Leptolyngbyaceae bacterium]
MLHILYLIAFAVVAFFAVSNLLRSMMTLGQDIRQGYGNGRDALNNSQDRASSSVNQPSHPELLDEGGKVMREPYLVMKSISVEDAREKLDALYHASPGGAADDDDAEPVA